ncbi:gamma carbonic anhydrase family protein [Lutibacter sp. B2]|nr:gamma carbonic anhydrase family protein [Lutibacter sp. B2]
MIKSYQKNNPEIDNSCYIAENATVIGRVTLKKNVNVWYGAVVRADDNDVVIGENTNIQDHCTIHIDDDFSTIIGEYVTVGHGAIIHGCTIGNNVLVGMGAIILNGAIIGENVIIGAGTLIPPGKKIPSDSLVIGSPGKVIRKLNEEEIEQIKKSAIHYVDLANKYKN